MKQNNNNKNLGLTFKTPVDCIPCIALGGNRCCMLGFETTVRQQTMQPAPAEPCFKPMTYPAYQTARAVRLNGGRANG